jgi:DNA-binding MarR family transcriptional regulator
VKVLTGLEQAGLLKRTRSKRDKRAVELRLSARGAELARKSAELADAFNEKILSPLRASERMKFVDMLARLADPHPVSRCSA